MVLAEIIEYPVKQRNPVGRILKVLGHSADPRIDTDLIIESYALPKVFSSSTLQEARALPERVTEEVIKDRRDLRQLITVTIDGEKAKDFDDAVSAQRLPDGLIRLWVHIADVGHYVPWDGALDREAYLRGTSVYFPDRVVPMFPEKLSNQICSLNPIEDRMTLTCEMVFDTEGERTSYALYESVINSNARLTYTEVKKILVDRQPLVGKRYQNLIGLLQILEDLALRLTKKRQRRGSIDFDLPEPDIILDLQGNTSDILRQERNIAHRIIEECMLAANETVAEHMTGLGHPFLYRIHEEPDPEKMAEFNDFIHSFGLHLKVLSKVKPKVLQNLLEQVKGTAVEKLINNLLLRSMKQARYSPEGKGHFGLASEHYTHFTSPIRRYPDLIVHRLLKEVLKGGPPSPKRWDQLIQLLPNIAKHSSEQERVAMEAEREVIDLKKTRFMADKVDEEFDAYITGVQSFGFFVELEQYFVEGLVHVTSLHDDYYIYLEKQHALIGEHQRRVFRVGDKLRVRVERVDLERRKIDFTLVESEEQKAKPKGHRKDQGKRRKKKRT
jgi:ribonuclease R